MNLKVGQVLWLKVKYQKNVVSNVIHPMIIYKIDNNIVEVIALDKTRGKLQNLYYPYNHYINSDNPKESVIYEDSYAQLNTKITLEYFSELIRYRRTTNILSCNKLNELISNYREYQLNHCINSDRVVFMNKSEIIKINRMF